MSSFGEDLIAAMKEAIAHAQGRGKVARVHSIEMSDVRAPRAVGPIATGIRQSLRR